MKSGTGALKRAIQALGGKTKAHKPIGVSRTTLHSWDKQGYIRDIHMALKVSKLTGIPLIEFAEEAKAAFPEKKKRK